MRRMCILVSGLWQSCIVISRLWQRFILVFKMSQMCIFVCRLWQRFIHVCRLWRRCIFVCRLWKRCIHVCRLWQRYILVCRLHHRSVYLFVDYVTEVYKNEKTITTLYCGVPERTAKSHYVRIVWFENMRRMIPAAGVEIIDVVGFSFFTSKIIINISFYSQLLFEIQKLWAKVLYAVKSVARPLFVFYRDASFTSILSNYVKWSLKSFVRPDWFLLGDFW